MRFFLFGIFVFSLSVLSACTPDPVSSFMGPMLLANSPVHFGDSPQGVRSRGRLVITNGGDTPLEINDFKVEPDDGIFQVGFSELPLKIAGRRSKEITIQFWPRAIGAFKADLSFDSNHDGDTLSPIVLLGNGTSEETCLPCAPPPEPECHFDRESSLVYIPNNSTDCDSEGGECGYRIIEVPCEEELCDLETGLCPGSTLPYFDAGPEPSTCGNGDLEEGEECDDGNTENGDGCSEICTVEDGWDCTEEPCEPICGDGQIAGDEACDDGNTENGDGCSEICTVEDGWDCTEEPCVTFCGDGILAGNEECDEGIGGDGGLGNSNTLPDACREDCTLPVCGDNVQDDNETCDDGNTIIEECDYGEETCSVCGPICSWVPGITSLCGDGVVQGFEECDDGDMNSLDEPDACRENCVLAFCGDETQDTDEECDLGPNPETVCPYGETSCLTCTNLCEAVSGTTQFCGDGEIQAPEECDNGTDSLTGNSNQRADACRMTCIAHSCGDGFIDSGEICDDGNNNPSDGCDTACLIEDGWECEGNPSNCTEIDYGLDGETCQNALLLTGSGGSVSGTYGETNELHPGAFGSPSCTDPYELAGGYEVVYKIVLAPGEGLQVTNAIAASSLVDMSIYLLDNCDPDVGSCLVGSDVVFEGDEESFNFEGFSSASGSQTVFLIIDAWCSSDSSYCPTPADSFGFNWWISSPN